MATYSTVQQLVDRIIRLSGQVPGTAVQVYSQDTFIDMINSTVRMIGRKAWWPHLCKWTTGTLDGATGTTTADLTGVLDFVDIKGVWLDNGPQRLPLFSDSQNFDLYTGTTAAGIEPLHYLDPLYSTKVFRVVPITSTGSVRIRARYLPDDLTVTSKAPFDSDLLVFGVLWSYFIDEGDNPQQYKKYERLFDSKFTELMAAQSEAGVSTNQNAPNGPGDWQYVR